MDNDVKEPATIWVVGKDPEKVESVRAALAEDGYALETMDAATAKLRFGAEQRPAGIVQFTRLVGHTALADPEDWLVDHPRKHLPEEIWWMVVSPLTRELQEDRLEGTPGPPWCMWLPDPLNPTELRQFTHRMMVGWGHIPEERPG